MSKYGEPWSLCYDGEIDDANGNMVVRLPFDSYKEFNDMAERDQWRRIVACVNAMAGIEDPVAEIARLKELAWMYEQLNK